MSLSNAPVTACIRVEDLDKAKEFYGEKLGLTLDKSMFEGNDLLYKAGDGTYLYIYKGPKSVAEHTVAAFMVEDLEGTVKDLKEKGVEFESYDMEQLKTDENNIATFEGFKSAWFKDPEGHIFAINNNPK